MKAPPSQPNYFLKAPYPNTITLGNRVQHVNWGCGTNIQSPATFISLLDYQKSFPYSLVSFQAISHKATRLMIVKCRSDYVMALFQTLRECFPFYLKYRRSRFAWFIKPAGSSFGFMSFSPCFTLLAFNSI